MGWYCGVLRDSVCHKISQGALLVSVKIAVSSSIFTVASFLDVSLPDKMRQKAF